MQLSKEIHAVPWEFDKEEVEQLQVVFSSPLVQAYLQSLKYLALSNSLVPPDASSHEDVKAANDYMAGQEFTLDALLATPLYVPQLTTQESNNV